MDYNTSTNITMTNPNNEIRLPQVIPNVVVISPTGTRPLSDKFRTDKLARKWGVLKNGVMWAQRLRLNVKRDVKDSGSPGETCPEAVTPVDDTVELSKKGVNRWKKALLVRPKPGFTLTDLNGSPSDMDQTTVIQSACLQPDCSVSDTMVKSASFGDYYRIKALRTDRAQISTTSFAKLFREKRVHRAEEDFQTFESRFPFPESHSPLPSPILELSELEHMRNIINTTDAEEPNSELTTCLPRSESSHSLESETSPVCATGEAKVIFPTTITTLTTTTASDEAGVESNERGLRQTESFQLRGRRRALVVDGEKLIGETGEYNPDGVYEASQTNNSSNSEDPTPTSSSNVSSINVFRERQRRMLRKQHTIANLGSLPAFQPQDYDPKRRAKVFLRLIERRSRSKESLLDLCDALQRLTTSKFHDHYLTSYRDCHWSQLTKNCSTEPNGPTETSKMPEREIQRREAVWELFKSELIFFIDHLMVLKNCFMEPLKKLQVDGYLMMVEPSNLFGNLDDLCYVSHTLCRELIGNLSRNSTTTDFGRTDVILQPLKRWSTNSKDGEVYHSYCLNYDAALSYLDNLRKYEQFNEFEKWCEQDPRCRRLQLTDLLIAPMQHYMKIPLLLANIRRYTADAMEQEMLTTCLNKVESSLKSLEDKMRWLKNFERLQEIQSQLIWPAVCELEPRVFIPEFLRHSLAKQPCERLLAHPKRQLLYEGYLTLNDGSKIIDIFAFLFDDFLLITRIKKQPKKKSFSENPLVARNMTEGGVFVVYRQAIALDRFTIHDLGIAEATANGLRHALVLVLITRFQQITGVYTLQATNELEKQRWLEKLRLSQQQFQVKLKVKLHGTDCARQTNKHSKLLSNKSRTQCGIETCVAPVKTLSVTPTLNRITAIPFRTSSASPTVVARSVLDDENISSDHLDTLPTCPPSIQLSSESGVNDIVQGEAIDSSIHVPTVELPDGSIRSDTISRGRLSMDPSLLTTSERSTRSLITSLVDTDASQRNPDKPKSKTLNRTESLVDTKYGGRGDDDDDDVEFDGSNNKDGRETRVEFLYNATGQQVFSPPLSPTLHIPCASLPDVVTLPGYYDFGDESDQRESGEDGT